jgi:MoaA/NifB/PqqE/SkfB family radical SAM enzyme
LTIEIPIRPRIKAMFISYIAACNSRCVTCDYWLIKERTGVDNEALLGAIKTRHAQGLQVVYFTGGEALLRSAQLFALVDELAVSCPSLSLHLLTNGVLLKKHSARIARSFSRVIVSMDGADHDLYRKIRGIRGFRLVTEGIAQLRADGPNLDIRLRTMVLLENVDSLLDIVQLGISLQVNRISFLAEDVSSSVVLGRDLAVVGSLARGHLDRSSFVDQLRRQIDEIRRLEVTVAGRPYLVSGLSDLERVLAIYSGQGGRGRCNAGLRSCVIDADGGVQPCFFIDAVGSLKNGGLGSVLDSPEYAGVVESILDRTRPECQNCVCPRYDEE